MQVLQDNVSGVLWHRVIPENKEEAKVAGKFLIPDNDGGFLDLGNSDSWERFNKATKNNDDFNSLFDSTLGE
jgi:hypothetical protein